MLDPELKEQLGQHFSGLKSVVTLAVRTSTHARQAELLELLNDVADSAPAKVQVRTVADSTDTVHFDLLHDGAPTGIRFRAVPGGHEFTSLVLAILNSDGLGRLPDDGLVARVKALRGPIHLRTFVSLSCTNCPDVVQALNQMALVHPDFTHETMDGELVPDEVARLGIQGVPAVFAGDKLIHVGKAGFGDLLDALEAHFGKAEQSAAAVSVRAYDVVVVGGGPAGAAAAIYSARKGLKTAVVAQKVGGQVNDTLGIENLITVAHTDGPHLAADLADHLRSNGVEVLEHRKVEEIREGERREVVLSGGDVLQAPALILATGARWRELGVPGEKEHIGRGVAFCPHCDGPFFKGRRVAVVGGGNSGVEAAIDLAGICSHVTLFEFAPELKADKVLVDKLKGLSHVTVMTNARTTEVVGNGETVSALRWQDRQSGENREVALDGVFVQIGLVPNSGFAKSLVETNRMGEIVIDEKCRTSAKGIYAAGDVTTVPYKQIAIALGEGAKAALSAFEDRMRAA